MSPTSVPTPEMRAARRDALSATLARNWWVVALRGAIAILFGVVAVAMPIVSLATLVYLFAAYLIVDGLFAIAAAIRAAQKHDRWGWLILEGVIDVLAALAAIASPGIAILVFVYLVAAWSIVSGALMTVAAFQLHLDHGRWWLAIAGVLSVIFGVLLALAPGTGALFLAIWIGVYALLFGAALVVLAFRLRSRAGSGRALPRG